MASDSLTMRLYRERALYEAARIIGYAGVEPFAFWDQAKELGLAEEVGKQKLLMAVYDLTRTDRREASPPRYELTGTARKACFQLLGPPPEHELHDFIKHGPPNVIGEENARRWQEQYRKKKQAETDQAVQGEPQADPEKRTNRSRSKGR